MLRRGFAEAGEDATAVKPWSFTIRPGSRSAPSIALRTGSLTTGGDFGICEEIRAEDIGDFGVRLVHKQSGVVL